MDELRDALQPVSRALRANAAALTAIREQLLIDAGRRDEVLRRVEEVLERVETRLEPVDQPRVARAREELQLSKLALSARLWRAPVTAWRWLVADRARLAAIVAALAGVLAQLADGAPLIATLGRALVAWGTSSAGGAP